MSRLVDRLRARLSEAEQHAAAALVRGEQWVWTSPTAASSPQLLLDDLPILTELLDEHGTDGPLCLPCLEAAPCGIVRTLRSQFLPAASSPAGGGEASSRKPC